MNLVSNYLEKNILSNTAKINVFTQNVVEITDQNRCILFGPPRILMLEVCRSVFYGPPCIGTIIQNREINHNTARRGAATDIQSSRSSAADF